MPIITGGGNGGSGTDVSTQKAVYNAGGSQVAVPGTTFHSWDWVKASGADLLDLSTPTNPVIITPGVYAVTHWLFGFGDASIAGCTILQDLQLGTSTDASEAVNQAPMSQTNPQGLDATVTLIWYLAAGQPVHAAVYHDDPAGQALNHQTTVQRLT